MLKFQKKIAHFHGLPLVLVLGMCGMWLVHAILMCRYNEFRRFQYGSFYIPPFLINIFLKVKFVPPPSIAFPKIFLS
jgi:hypothetical protein